MISPEELIGQLITLSQEDVERSFEKGEIIAHLVHMGYTHSQIGSEVNCSAQTIRVLERTYKAFPKEEERIYAEQSFYHYRLAATTDEPHKLMQQAMENEWSTREMANVVKKKPTPEEYREAERLLFKVKTFINSDTKESQWFRGKLFELLSKEELRNVI